ncbi:uncharacterized protein BDR25DRAFT_51725 [Lindgomyces ingoldianus]|uniref:Uncharacterized protein n=1 Tax=Lindgomyces ingoldianus TaxID=673940 RepID=A0ACB6QSY7_9PLEO|nr:uncharacterized protein BDR25DRAFT_51725 [Lindgomyces ingoldianus]KAF2469192.1 hypothetical protein BDR25DRAFT_51725 [Lindgomyces ingoldianus]
MAAEPNDAQKANVDATQQEALDYWGYLIKPDKCGTETLDRLLKGIADVISKKFEPHDCQDLTPSQLSAFYREVGGNYDVLFIETPPSSIAFIYRSLGAFHSLQPAPDDDGYSCPAIPALKKKGFVTWQTIQLLLGPEEHVPFLQKAVQQFDVVDPETGNLFPKILPKECFPDRPDDAMEAWYQGVAERLKREAEEDAAEKDDVTRVHVEVDDSAPRMSSEMSGEGSADDRHGAAKYFEDPLYRKGRLRPTFVRRFSKASPRQYVEDRGRMVAHTVRHMWNPFNRRRSLPGRYEEDSFSDDDVTPIATAAPPPRYSHKRPLPPRREDSLSTTDSESDSDGPLSRHRPPVLRHRRSHEPATSPREYFPPTFDERRYSQDAPANKKQDGPAPLYGPTKSPLFATHVAQLQAHNYYDRRPALASRGSYRPHGVRYTVRPPSPREPDLPYVRDGYDPSSSSSIRPRRRSDEHIREREVRERSDKGRTRSHDRVKDDWDDRDRSRDRDRGRDKRDRSRTHRYVAGVQDGVGGRRYPVEQPW